MDKFGLIIGVLFGHKCYSALINALPFAIRKTTPQNRFFSTTVTYDCFGSWFYRLFFHIVNETYKSFWLLVF